MANKILVRAGAILREANCKTMREFWERMGRPDLVDIPERDFQSPVYLDALHLAQKNVPPSRNPRNVAFAKDRALRAEAKNRVRAKRSEARMPKVYRAERRNARRVGFAQDIKAQRITLGLSRRDNDRRRWLEQLAAKKEKQHGTA